MGEDTCRMMGCDEPPRGEGGAFSRKFCSDQCEVKFEHIRADARDAQRSEEQGAGRTIRGP